MLNTYIKNRGMTKTIIHNNNHNTINQTNWDADYDGSVANISLDLSKNGRNKHFDFQLDNNDLANILTIPSIKQPIHKRLKMDFKKPETFKQIFLEIQPEKNDDFDFDNIDTIFDNDNDDTSPSIPVQKILTHMSSPKTDEQFIIPFQNLQIEQPAIKIIRKPSSKKSTRRHKHHNYPSHRKSPRRSTRSKKR